MAGKREEQMKEITERLEQGVKELFTSEKYTEYLKAMSQFHNYSFNNTVLIAMQRPDAALVAGLGTWNKKFNRRVKRGERGIKIFAPISARQKKEVEKFDPVTNEPLLRPDGQPETEEIEYVIPRFRVVTVFDVSQTEGDPLPELDAPELLGSMENFEIFMEAIQNVSPAPMRYAEIQGESKGYYSNMDKEIVLQEGMSEKQTMKTAVHEVTHAMCHDRERMEEAGEKKNQMTKEVEAESVAYTVCQYFGLDTSDYSFPYIAGWSSSMEMQELRTSVDFIRKTAGDFIDSMVENIQNLQREQPEREQPEKEQPEENGLHEAGAVGATEFPVKKEDAAEHPAAKKENASLPVYKYPLAHALEHDEKSVYHLSRKENIACRNAIEQAIRENFDGMYLNRDAVKQVLAQFGAERVAYVLAYTVYEKDWDGRFSRDNKAWAKNTSFCEDKDGCGDERKTAFVVQSHPAVLNMFVDFARKEMPVLPNKKQSVLQALRERQARMKAQEKEGQGQRAPAHSKREQGQRVPAHSKKGQEL